MIINETTLIISILVLLLALIAPLCSPYFRFRRDLRRLITTAEVSDEEEIVETAEDVDSSQHNDNTANDIQTTEPPNITVLVTVHEQAKELAKHLPALLEQEYEGAFEVVIVAEQGDHETEMVLKRFANNPHLYATFVPTSSRYMSRKKLAITLGVKAAKHEWILLTEADCQPASSTWLLEMSRHCTQEAQLVMGYSQYEPAAPTLYQLERWYSDLYLLHQAHRSIAYRTNSCNLMFRKSGFIAQDGYRGNLQLLRGEYDFIVNKFAAPQANTVCIEPASWMIEDIPTKKKRRNQLLFELASRPLLQRSFRLHLIYKVDQVMLYLSYLVTFIVLGIAISKANWMLIVTAAVALLCTIGMRMWVITKPLKFFMPHLSTWQVLCYEPTIVWRNLLFKQRFRKADDYDFTSHKL